MLYRRIQHCCLHMRPLSSQASSVFTCVLCLPIQFFPIRFTNVFQPQYGPRIHSASNRNEYQGSSWRVKRGRRVWLTTSPTSENRPTENVGSSTSHNPIDLPWPATAIAFFRSINRPGMLRHWWPSHSVGVPARDDSFRFATWPLGYAAQPPAQWLPDNLISCGDSRHAHAITA
jgi:hypothetical protein